MKQSGVVHVSSAHPWTDNRIHYREAASLVAAGYEVHLVAVEHELNSEPTGVRVHLLPSRPRLARFLVSSVQAILMALWTGARIVHLHDPELVWSIPLLRLLGRAVIYDAHEDLPAQTLNKRYIPRALRPFVARLARLVIRVAGTSDHVVAATETVAEAFPSNRVTVVHNYPKVEGTGSGLVPLSRRPPRVVYVGQVSTERGVPKFVEALGSDQFPAGWSGVIAGGCSPASLQGEMEELPGWARVDYKGVIAPSAARVLMEQSRAGIVILERNPAYLDSLPTKMFEYMAAGIPVIASDFPRWREFVIADDCGVLVDETDATAVARAVAAYAADPELLERHGANARKVAQSQRNWSTEEQALLGVYSQLNERQGRD